MGSPSETSLVAIVIVVILSIPAIFIWLVCRHSKDDEKVIPAPTAEERENAYLSENNIPVTKKYEYPDPKLRSTVAVSEPNRELVIFRSYGDTLRLPFEKVLGCEIFVDSQTDGKVGRAFVGGALFGGAGAIVGTMSAKEYIYSYVLSIYTEEFQNPKIDLVLINSKTSTVGVLSSPYLFAKYFAQNVSACIKAILATASKQETPSEKTAEEKAGKEPQERLRQIHDLWENGLITQEEYNEKRKEILNSL